MRGGIHVDRKSNLLIVISKKEKVGIWVKLPSLSHESGAYGERLWQVFFFKRCVSEALIVVGFPVIVQRKVEEYLITCTAIYGEHHTNHQ